MQFITGQQRNQTYVATLDDQVAADNTISLWMHLLILRQAQ